MVPGALFGAALKNVGFEYRSLRTGKKHATYLTTRPSLDILFIISVNVGVILVNVDNVIRKLKLARKYDLRAKYFNVYLTNTEV